MLLECQNCGAPLEAPANARFVKCTYCGRSSTVSAMRTVAQQTPQGWQPPPVWTPPAHFPMQSQPIRYQAANTASGARIAIPILISLLIAAGAAVPLFMRMGRSATSSFTSGASPVPVSTQSKGEAWDGTAPLDCGINEELVIDNKKVKLDDTLIKSTVNCKLTIKNSTLEGRTIVKAGMNTNLVIENSKLIAKEAVVDASQHVEIRVRKNSELSSEEKGIVTSQASKLYIDDSKVHASEVAVETSQGTRLELHGATIESDETAIKMGQVSEFDSTDSSVKGGEVSLELGQNSDVSLRGTKLTGTKKLGPRTKLREK